MPADPAKNFAKVLVVGVYDDSATTIQLASGELSKLPNPSTDGQFNLVWWNATDYTDPADDPYKEIVRVTAVDNVNNTITVIRGQENTIAQPHNIPNKVYKMMLALTQKTYADLQKIDVYQGSTFVGYRNKLSFVSPLTAEDDAINQLIKISLTGKFGGDGSDGDLIISSGTTTIDLQNQKIFIKNYGNLKITGTASLNFINPHDEGTLIIFKVKNDCEITSTTNPAIDLRNLGGISDRGFFYCMNSYYSVWEVIENDYTQIGGYGGASSVNKGTNVPFVQTVIERADVPSVAAGVIDQGLVTANGGRGGGGLYIEVSGNFVGNSSTVIDARGSNGQSAYYSRGSGSSLVNFRWRQQLSFSLPPFPFINIPEKFFLLAIPGSGGMKKQIRVAGYSTYGYIYGGGGGGGSVVILVNGTISNSLNFNVSGGFSDTTKTGADGIGLILQNKLFV